jgi:hypothetical protein
MKAKTEPTPIYTTSGKVGGFLLGDYIFDPYGEWIGFIEENQQVYSVYGHYVGWLSKDRRILRKFSQDFSHPKHSPPPHPDVFHPPAVVALAPLMSEIGHNTIDVLDERPDLMPTHGDYAFNEDID